MRSISLQLLTGCRGHLRVETVRSACLLSVFGLGHFNHRRWRVSQTFEREITHCKVPAMPSASLVMAITECQAAREEPLPLSVAVSDVAYQVAGDRRVHSCVPSLQVCGCEVRKDASSLILACKIYTLSGETRRSVWSGPVQVNKRR